MELIANIIDLVYLGEMLKNVCYICIDLMKMMTCTWGCTYGVLNTLLFVILGPLAVLCCFFAAFLSYFDKKKVSKGFLIAGLTATFVIFFMIFTTMIDALFPHVGHTDEAMKATLLISGYEGTSFLDKVCYVAIDGLIVMSKCLNISYGALNTILYVIIGPLTTVLYAVAAALSYLNKKTASVVLFAISCAMIFVFILMILITLIRMN